MVTSEIDVVNESFTTIETQEFNNQKTILH